ncbi:MAG: signal peptidase II [Gammaproteobacteria bacterium]|nr:signal peptidase II [Gammaproteobacteria bacterium]
MLYSSKIKKIITKIIVVIATFLVDRCTKNIFIKYEQGIWNSGISFGLMRGSPVLPFIIALCVGYLFFILTQEKGYVKLVSLSMVLGGAAGNLYDRFLFGAVYDFINIGFNFPVFNIADMTIFTGGFIYFISVRRSPIRCKV